MSAVLNERETTAEPTVGARKDEAPGIDAFMKALLARPPAAVSPAIRDGRAVVADRLRGVRILARSLVRDLVRDGFEAGHVVALSTELIELTTSMLRVRAAAERERLEATPDCAVVPLHARSGS